ncbi:MAG TPA: cysteine--tRNA ligase [Steroidobacteraceae bacterium]|nr:cysteine--tRNA ligase [Steroidobacteraceae bacterium]
MHPIKIHNSLTGRKEEFVPLQAGRIGIYVCGMTVYDYCHIGHGRMLVVFDMAVRYLRSLGYSVTYVRNITDIDDKIIKRAAENKEPIDALTARFIRAMDEDCEALGMLKPDHEPRATQYVPAIIKMVQQLVSKGFAYAADDGDVLYSVSSFPGYGKLSGKQLKDLRAGARVEIDPAKRDPLDFVLWKAAKPGEPSWDSPWGKGRPGWHIECSAMSTQVLGNHFDLHGGGVDLKFPHHENEIAQSCAALDTKFVNVWMHNGFVRINDEKMSKSLDNFFTIRDVVKVYHPEAVRYFLLATHYRAPINYSEENLLQAKAALDRLYTALRGVEPSTTAVTGETLERFRAAMSDDFNTPEAFAVLQSIARDLNTAKAEGRSSDARTFAGQLRQLAGILGLLRHDPEQWFQQATGTQADNELTDAQIEELIKDRVAARQAQNWKESDRIRDLLAAAGIVLEDGSKGTTWRRK